MIIEVIKEETVDYLRKRLDDEAKSKGVSEEFLNKFQVVFGETRETEEGEKKFELTKERIGISKGKVLSMSPDCFGEAFKTKFGVDREVPKVGDIVFFVPHKTYQLDAENKIHILDDCEIVGYLESELV